MSISVVPSFRTSTVSATFCSRAGRRVADAFAERDLVGAVGYVERCNPALRALRERLDAGELGQVYQVLTRRQGPFPARIKRSVYF